MRLAVLALTLPLLCSCSLLQVPGRTLKSVGRTFGFAHNDTGAPAAPIAVKFVEEIRERPELTAD